MRFSIITCTWNSEPYLAQAVASVLAQDYDDYEWIFVDGGSTDGTLERIASIQRPIILLKNVRGGIARAMNEGVRAATGDVVAHMHSDDYYLGRRVLSQVSAAFSQQKGDWLYGRSMYEVEGNLQREGYVVPRYSHRKLLRRNLIPHASTFVKRSLFEKYGLFDESYKLAMDYEMWLRLAMHGAPVQLDEYLAAFRVHPGSATRKHAARSFHEDFRARFAYARLTEYPEFVARYFVRIARAGIRHFSTSSA